MGACLSKKKKKDPAPKPNPTTSNETKKKTNKKIVAAINAETPKELTKPPQQSSSTNAPVQKKAVFAIVQTPSKPTSSSSSNSKDETQKEEPKKSDAEPKSMKNSAESVRTSNCTKEEVDAILIQCGRLSRSSSAKAASERKYSGSKRSYDFDNEKDWNDDQNQKQQQEQRSSSSRPSPRRRTPSRERSGSRERGSQRRVSRSPNRRSETAMAAANSSSSGSCDKQPAKMVSVPAREKGVANKRNASPRSRSPANTANTRVSNENALSRSSSRKQEHSPYRRNPMTEIDSNSVKSSNSSKTMKSKEPQIQSQNNGAKCSSSKTNSNCVRDQLMSCRPKEKPQEPEIEEEAKETDRKLARSRSSRRSSRDLDNLNSTTYTSLLLEDIQNHHQQNVGFSLPACVSKARSILEAVADLNSSSSDQSKNNDIGRFVESEIEMKDELMEPSLHKYVSVRDIGGEMEPQESAGSNSFVGQPWFSSVESAERYWASQQSNNEEEVEQVVDVARGTRFSNNKGSSSKRVLHRGGSGGSAGSRACSLPVASATS